MGFDLKTWSVETVVLTDADGNEARVLHKPVTVGWRARWAEVIAAIPNGASLGEDPSMEAIAGYWREAAESGQKVAEAWADFARDLLSDLVVGTRDLFLGDDETAPTTAELLDALGNYGPSNSKAAPLISLMLQVMRSGQTTESGNA